MTLAANQTWMRVLQTKTRFSEIHIFLRILLLKAALWTSQAGILNQVFNVPRQTVQAD